MILINGTEDTPKVVGDEDGTLSIIGRSLAEDPVAFYKPVLDWVSQLKQETIEINVRLDYFNTSSSLQIYNILRNAKTNLWKKNIQINWYYDISDEEGLELGKEFESLLGIPFEFYNFLDY